MILTVLLVVVIEILMVASFVAGLTVGRTKAKPINAQTTIVTNTPDMDPVSPEDQKLFKKLERESRKYVFKD